MQRSESHRDSAPPQSQGRDEEKQNSLANELSHFSFPLRDILSSKCLQGVPRPLILHNTQSQCPPARFSNQRTRASDGKSGQADSRTSRKHCKQLETNGFRVLTLTQLIGLQEFIAEEGGSDMYRNRGTQMEPNYATQRESVSRSSSSRKTLVVLVLSLR